MSIPVSDSIRSGREASHEPQGYAARAYAASLSHIGEHVELPGSRSWILRRPIPGTDHADACGCYPLMSCPEGGELEADLAGLGSSLVSLVAVLDPLVSPETRWREAAFPDLLRPFKRHYLVDLEQDFVGARDSHHRRNVRRAAGAVTVERAERPEEHGGEWSALYRGLLADREAGAGPADFSDEGLRAQLQLSGLHYYRASLEGVCVAACLWLDQGQHVVYHLGASSEAGRRASASFALFDAALEDAARRGVRVANLGGAAGLEDDADDGLARFKRGWSNDSVTAHLGGRILDPEAYRLLSAPSPSATSFFPAYRCGVRS